MSILMMVPKGKYQRVPMANHSPVLEAKDHLNIHATVKNNQPIPKRRNMGPNCITATPRDSNSMAQGPGFSGPMYLPLNSTCKPSAVIKAPLMNASNAMSQRMVQTPGALGLILIIHCTP